MKRRYHVAPGDRFGKLIVIAEDGGCLVRCQCDCGSIVRVKRTNLVRRTRSCGCLWAEVRNLGRVIHGHSKSREYVSWAGAKNRCYNTKYVQYERYGARGITMAEKWLHNFEAFRADMGPCPAGHSLDRIDNDGPYAPENCRWATRTQQCRNTGRNVRLTLNGITRTLTEWADVLNVHRRSLSKRFSQHKWSAEKTLTHPGLTPRHL